MTNEERVKKSIHESEQRLVKYRATLDDIAAKERAFAEQQKPLQRQLADGDARAIQKLAALRAEAATLIIQKDAVTRVMAEVQAELAELNEGLVPAREQDANEMILEDKTPKLLSVYEKIEAGVSALSLLFDKAQEIESDISRLNSTLREPHKLNFSFSRRWVSVKLPWAQSQVTQGMLKDRARMDPTNTEPPSVMLKYMIHREIKKAA